MSNKPRFTFNVHLSDAYQQDLEEGKYVGDIRMYCVEGWRCLDYFPKETRWETPTPKIGRTYKSLPPSSDIARKD